MTSLNLHLIALSILIALMALPLIFKWVPPNQIYGFRTARTLADTGLWYRANHFCGWAILMSTVVSFVSLVAFPMASDMLLLLVEFAAPILVAAATSYFYLGRVA